MTALSLDLDDTLWTLGGVIENADRAMFEAVARHTAVPLHSIIHVGDDPERDVVGAAAHGLRAIWLNRNAKPWPDDVPELAPEQIRSLEELPELLFSDLR